MAFSEGIFPVKSLKKNLKKSLFFPKLRQLKRDKTLKEKHPLLEGLQNV